MMKSNMNARMMIVCSEIVRESVQWCGERYGFDAESALKELELDEYVLESKSKSKSKTKKVVIDLPFSASNVKEDGCQGLCYNKGLFTQCKKVRMEEGAYCKTCSKECKNSSNGKPLNGTVEERMACDLMEYTDAKGRKPIRYVKYLEMNNLRRLDAEEAARNEKIEIDERHFEESEVVSDKSRGRPKAEKKKKVAVETVEDLFAKLMINEEDEVLGSEENTIVMSESEDESEKITKEEELENEKSERNQMKQEETEQKKTERMNKQHEMKLAAKAEKDAKLAQEKAEKALKLALEKAEKEAKLVQEKAEKEAKLVQEKAEKEAKLEAIKAEKEAKLAQDKLEKEAKALKLAQEKAEKEAKLEAVKAEKEAKALKLAQDKAEKEAKLALEKEAKASKLAQEKAEKEAKLALEKEGKKTPVKEKSAAKKTPVKEVAPKKVEKVEDAASKKVEKVEEAAPKKVTVTRITIDGVQYLKTGENLLYNPDTKEEVGIYNPETKMIMSLPDESDGEIDEEEYESDDE